MHTQEKSKGGIQFFKEGIGKLKNPPTNCALCGWRAHRFSIKSDDFSDNIVVRKDLAHFLKHRTIDRLERMTLIDLVESIFVHEWPST